VLADGELIALALLNHDGMVRVEEGRHLRVSVPVGLIATDRRIIFAALDSDGSDAGTLAYDEVSGIDRDGNRLVFTATDGVVWRFPLRATESVPVDIAVRHLCWVGEVRNRLVGAGNDVELAVGQIQAEVEDHQWDDARETYREIRSQIDDLTSTVQLTTPLSQAVLAPELADLEEALESACVRFHIERARSLLELGKEFVSSLDYEEARTALAEAYDHYELAKAHRDEVERPDSFQFGQQRELTHELEALAWEIESAAAEPLQQASETKARAQASDDLQQAIELWETAFRRYEGVLNLEWDDRRQFAGDPEMIDAELDSIADRLIDLHERAARERWDAGAELEAEGDLREAIRECGAALDHLDRVHDLAEDFDPEQIRTFENQLKEMFEQFLDRRRSSERGGDRVEPSEERQGGDVDPDEQGPSLEGLSEMASHQEITFELRGGDADDRPWADADTGRFSGERTPDEGEHSEDDGHSERTKSTGR